MPLLPALLLLISVAFGQSGLPAGVTFRRGAVNTVTISDAMSVYSAPASLAKNGRVLLTHVRRNAIGRLPSDAVVVAPPGEIDLLKNPDAFWRDLETARFHDYAESSTRVPVSAAPHVEPAQLDTPVAIAGVSVRAIATPGYTPGAVSYVVEGGGKRAVCTGDLIYGNGQILDLYSLQDAVPEAKARGYHGYAARAGDVIASLRKISALQPDLLLPAHGPAITDPQRSIHLLIDRMQTFLQSHFETDALRWYWGEENHKIRSRAVERPMQVLEMAEQEELPVDILAVGNSRIIVSKSGAAFVLDAGYKGTMPELKRLLQEGRIKSVDGLWISHYHDDHTDFINDVVSTWQAPVYFAETMTEVMSNPSGFHLPCLTTHASPTEDATRNGQILRWHEWQLTFLRFPGQTLYHGALAARRDDGQTYLFVGDSFTPSGMDDYCMQNRDFLRRGEGYDYCLRKVGTFPPGTWLINEHVKPMFRYTPAQLSRMLDELDKRSQILRAMTPWPDINYMIDASWARMYPYGQEAKPGDLVRVALRITNHASTAVTYHSSWHVPSGLELVSADRSATVPARRDGEIRATFRTLSAGLNVVTADVSFGDWNLPEWTEAIIRTH